MRLKIFSSGFVNFYARGGKISGQKIKNEPTVMLTLAKQNEISMDPAPILKNNFHSGRRLTDKPDIFLESLDNSEQNQHRCIFNYFLKFFWVGPLVKC